MAYAIIQTGGKQFRVTEGEVVRVPSITAEIGSSVEFDVLVSGDGDQINIGAPVLDGPRVNPSANHREIWVRDLDGYVVVLAGRYGDV